MTQIYVLELVFKYIYATRAASSDGGGSDSGVNISFHFSCFTFVNDADAHCEKACTEFWAKIIFRPNVSAFAV